MSACCLSGTHRCWELRMLCRPFLGEVPMPDPALHPLCPLSLPSASPWCLAEPRRSLSCPLGTDDKWLLTLSLCKLLLLLFPVPASLDRPARGRAGSGQDCVSRLGGRRLGRSDACVAFGSGAPARLTAAPEPGIARDTPLLPAAGAAWCRRKCSTAAVAWRTAPELRKNPCSLLPVWSPGWTLPGVAALGLFPM